MATKNNKKTSAKKTTEVKNNKTNKEKTPKKENKKEKVSATTKTATKKNKKKSDKVEVKETVKEVSASTPAIEVNEVKAEPKKEEATTTEPIIQSQQEQPKKERKKIEVDASTLSKDEITKKVVKGTTKAIEKAIDENKDVRTGKPNPKEKRMLFISALISTLAVLAFMFIPFSKSISPLDFFTKDISSLGNNGIYSTVIFSVLALVVVIDAYLIINTLMHYKSDNFLEKVARIYNLNFSISIIYGLVSLAAFVINVLNSKTEATFGIILTAVQVLILVFNAVIKSYFVKDYVFIDKNVSYDENSGTEQVGEIKSFKRPFPSSELLIYVIIFALLPIGALFINLFTITANGTTVLTPSIRGVDFFINAMAGKIQNMGNQIILFILILFVIADAISLITSFLVFFAKRRSFYKLAAASLVFNFCFVLFITLYGLYYKIIIAVDTEMMLSWLSDFFTEEVIATIKTVKVDTQGYYFAIAAVVLLIVTLVRNPSRHALAYEQLDEKELMENRLNAPKVCEETVGDFVNDYDLLNLEEENNVDNGGGNGIAETDEENPLDVNLVEKEEDEDKYLEKFDACPAFTEIDENEDSFKADLKAREKTTFSDVTLPSLTKFIVNYAKNSRLHLSYSREDIAAFIAGLGCTRLTILQGMSGTGKTSLPKIFMEAIYGNCELIEIESSWREKNELLGFYNEFSKIYTPKKFTQRLYKAALNPEIITFIVLDEMNLSRIEYYFSDFLSLMENEEDFRKIKLSNVKLYNIYQGTRHSYKKLEDDHTFKVPSNVWFIGTANRDESTFEISDKVYDRAHTMNFNKRAPAIIDFQDPMSKRFLKYDDLHKLFTNAIKSYKFDIEKNAIIKRVEELLVPFNISFGNRIYKQITEFVKVYCSCFDNPAIHEFDAVETILLTKVVMKLENKNIDNREFLINEFKKLKLTRCVDFISKLSEDF